WKGGSKGIGGWLLAGLRLASGWLLGWILDFWILAGFWLVSGFWLGCWLGCWPGRWLLAGFWLGCWLVGGLVGWLATAIVAIGAVDAKLPPNLLVPVRGCRSPLASAGPRCHGQAHINPRPQAPKNLLQTTRPSPKPTPPTLHTYLHLDTFSTLYAKTRHALHPP
ncbi:hypothetical protein AOQ84DRAFT_419094, partial [Glonium stellatum]